MHNHFLPLLTVFFLLVLFFLVFFTRLSHDDLNSARHPKQLWTSVRERLLFNCIKLVFCCIVSISEKIFATSWSSLDIGYGLKKKCINKFKCRDNISCWVYPDIQQFWSFKRNHLTHQVLAMTSQLVHYHFLDCFSSNHYH